VQYEYVGAKGQAQDNWNGTFVFAQSNAPFNAADPRTYPDSFSDPSAGPLNQLREGPVPRCIRAG